MSDEDLPQLIECGDHGMAPWCLCCTHLMMHETNKAVAIPNPHIKEVDYDWVCSDCFEVMQKDGAEALMEDNLLACVCINCMNHILETCEKDLPE